MEIEIPFGAFDSELGGWEYTIPEGYKAEIKDGRVIVKRKENEDERIRKILVGMVNNQTGEWKDKDKILAYLKKLKEQKPLSTEETELNSIAFLEQLGYTCVPPGKAEWGGEDKRGTVELKTFIAQCNGFNKENRKKAFDMIDALYSQLHWKPSEEQMKALGIAIRCGIQLGTWEEDALCSLNDDLKKL